MAESEADAPTFWLEASGRSRRDSSAFFLLLLILYLAASVAFVLLALPAFLTLASQFFRPRSVNKSCDSLNIVLVLLAIVCVLLGRSNSGGGGGSSGSSPEWDSRKSSSSSSSNPGKPYKCYGSDDLLSSEGSEYGFSRSSSGRMRNSSSCPDPRAQDPPSDHGEGWRFYDDTHLVAGRGFGSEPVYSEASSPSTVNYESSDASDSGSQSPRIPIPLPPPPPPFEVQPWEVIVRGDYAWIKRTNSWPHDTPDTKDFEEASVSRTIESPSNASLGATSPECCRIPDVNKRADIFIAEFRTRLNLEMMNYVKQKRSKLAPERTG